MVQSQGMRTNQCSYWHGEQASAALSTKACIPKLSHCMHARAAIHALPKYSFICSCDECEALRIGVLCIMPEKLSSGNTYVADHNVNTFVLLPCLLHRWNTMHGKHDVCPNVELADVHQIGPKLITILHHTSLYVWQNHSTSMNYMDFPIKKCQNNDASPYEQTQALMLLASRKVGEKHCMMHMYRDLLADQFPKTRRGDLNP